MKTWTFEPGHTAAEFRARHMMVTWVRGQFKNVEGKLSFDEENPANSSVEATIDAKGVSTGEQMRDDHLRSADFLDVENHPTITFKSTKVTLVGENDYIVIGKLTIRGTTKEVSLDVRYLGQWNTPFWVDDKDEGPKKRAGFVAKTVINRLDFGVSWQDKMEKGGIVVSDELLLTIDVEAIED